MSIQQSEPSYRILIIEDDKEIATMLSEYLTRNGFCTQVAGNGPEGLHQALTASFDCLLLDLMLPYKSGDVVLKQLREASQVPVIVLSAKGLTQNKVELFALGADDYLTKPFDLDELLARIHAHIKRYHAGTNLVEPARAFGPVTIDPTAKTATVSGRPLNLTAKEYAILYLLIKNPAKIFSKQNLYESVWGEQYSYDNDTINTHMSNLRKKIGLDLIKTVWNMGYKLDDSLL
ncbi:MAG: response regulator transcription factor [Lachnospiraceae bacterium]|jgi:DNA-binding response OmpR family regulator|nr:response regulator transcription factor [Lachnospiraceae bacterium]